MKLAMATSRPEQVIGMHFFNPVPVLQLVELVPSLLTDDRRPAAAAEGFAAERARQDTSSAPRTGPASSSTRC